MLGREQKTVNPVGNPKIKSIPPNPKAPKDDFTRKSFISNLKKASRRLK